MEKPRAQDPGTWEPMPPSSEVFGGSPIFRGSQVGWGGLDGDSGGGTGLGDG